MDISLCMIVKNEEPTLARCLSSVRDAVDEIIIVDTGSNDRTVEIARTFTDRVYSFAWIDDFSAARNYAFSFAQKEYIMWLDADDVLTKPDLDKLIVLKQSLSGDIRTVYCLYHIAFDASDRPTFSYYRERIVKREPGVQWVEPIHEVILCRRPHIYSDIAVEHRKARANPPGRNLKIFEAHIAGGKPLSARLQFYYARELMQNGRLQDAVKEFESYLTMPDGWVENRIEATRNLADCQILLGDSTAAILTLFRGFLYAPPRAETLCKIGELFLKERKLHEAEYWYLRAAECPKDAEGMGFVQPEYYDMIPYLQLCVIYDKLGNHIKAREYNERAGQLKPEHPSYLYNAEYFKKRLSE